MQQTVTSIGDMQTDKMQNEKQMDLIEMCGTFCNFKELNDLGRNNVWCCCYVMMIRSEDGIGFDRTVLWMACNL